MAGYCISISIAMLSAIDHRYLHRTTRGLLLTTLLILSSACASPAVRAYPPPQATASLAPPTSTRIKRSSTPTPAINPTPPNDSASPTATPTVPVPTPTPTIDLSACLAAGGRMERHRPRTELLPQALEYRIYLPPCYDQQPDRHYPVLYLIHGQSYTDDQWDRLGADDAADILIGTGEIPPLIIVMPRDRVWKQPSQDNFGRAIIEQLIPFVDEVYRTLPERRFRAIGGLSRGASWAVHLGLSHWELFGAIGAHSLPVFFEDVGRIDRWLNAIPMEQWPRIWLDIGDHDSENLRTSTSWFEERLTEHGIPHEYYVFPGWHDEKYWGSHVELYLRWYAADW